MRLVLRKESLPIWDLAPSEVKEASAVLIWMVVLCLLFLLFRPHFRVWVLTLD